MAPTFVLIGLRPMLKDLFQHHLWLGLQYQRVWNWQTFSAKSNLCGQCCELFREARKLIEENLKVVRAKFSTLSQAFFVMSIIAWHRLIQQHLELKTRPRFRPISLNLSVAYSTFQTRVEMFESHIRRLNKLRRIHTLHFFDLRLSPAS
jgi:hypothetical protein